jgi:hypothetical protein
MAEEQLMKTRIQDHRTQTRRQPAMLLNPQQQIRWYAGAHQTAVATSISVPETLLNWLTS